MRVDTNMRMRGGVGYLVKNKEVIVLFFVRLSSVAVIVGRGTCTYWHCSRYDIRVSAVIGQRSAARRPGEYGSDGASWR